MKKGILMRFSWLKLFLLAAVLILICLQLVAQNITDKVSPDRSLLDEKLENGELQRVENEIRDLREENKEIRQDLDKIKPFENWSLVLTVFGVGIASLALLILKFIRSKVREQVDEKITKLFTDRRDDFLSLLKDYDLEKVMKSRHQIVLMSHPSCQDSYHYQMLLNNGFQVRALTNVIQLNTSQFSENEILIINNDGGNWELSEVENFINGCSNYCFYFGNGKININSQRLNRFAAANFRTQFIGNLINILKYSHH